jgi:hypothetical protein
MKAIQKLKFKISKIFLFIETHLQYFQFAYNVCELLDIFFPYPVLEYIKTALQILLGY